MGGIGYPSNPRVSGSGPTCQQSSGRSAGPSGGMAGRVRVRRGGERRPGPGREIGLRVCLKPSVLRRLAPSRHVQSSPLRSHRTLRAPIFLHGRTQHLHSFPLSSRTPDLDLVWLSLSVFGTSPALDVRDVCVYTGCFPDVQGIGDCVAAPLELSAGAQELH